MWAWPELQGAVLDYHATRFDDALRRLAAVRSFAFSGPYHSLGARALWVEGIVLTQQGDLAAALTAMRQAQNTFETLGESENVVAIAGTTADSLRILGDASEAWRAVQRSLAGLDAVRRPVRRYVLLHNAALLAFRMGFDEAAADLSRASIDEAASGGRPGPILEAQAWTAVIEARRGALDQASHAAREAERLLPTVADPVLQSALQADVAYARAASLMHSSPAQAFDAATLAVDIFSRNDPPLALGIFGFKARAAVSTGRPDLARSTLGSGIQMFEDRLRKLPDERFRISYFDDAWELYTAGARLELDTGERAAAFDLLEKARSRVLLEALTRTNDVARLDSARLAIPRGVVVVAYASLPDELLTWVLSSGSESLHRQSVTREALDREVEAYRAAAAASSEPPPAGVLERVLLAPWIGRVPAGATVVIVADGPLHQLPFAGLRMDADTLLIEKHPLATAPSVTTFLALARRQSTGGSPRSALLVAAADAAGREDRLPHLPAVEGEIADARRAYPSATVLAGEDATAERLAALADSFDVVHFGGHAIANDEFPLTSALVLSGGERLTVEEFSRLTFRRTRLVVLAACSTARGAIWRGEGVLSVARPFLASGVPTVVAALADIDDSVSRKVFSVFHQRVGQGRSAAEALQAAQVALLRSGSAADRRLAVWTPFVVIGAP
jgi:CHAT domain-containing protein